MTVWTDLSQKFYFGQRCYSADMTALNNNITALAEDASGAPDIQGTAFVEGSITASKLDGLTATIPEINARCLNVGVSLPLQTILQIGAWNMQSTATVYVPFALGDVGKPFSINGVIYNDAQTQAYTIPCITTSSYANLFIYYSSRTSIRIDRGAYFVGASFSSTGINRGYLVVSYLP